MTTKRKAANDGIYASFSGFFFGSGHKNAINRKSFLEALDVLLPSRELTMNYFMCSDAQKRRAYAEQLLLTLASSHPLSPPPDYLFNLSTFEERLKSDTKPGAKFIPRDHCVHLFNLYLLGIFLFSQHKELHDHICEQVGNWTLKNNGLSRRARSNPYMRFWQVWVPFVLYHDLAYPLEMIAPDKRDDLDNELCKVCTKFLEFNLNEGKNFAIRFMADWIEANLYIREKIGSPLDISFKDREVFSANIRGEHGKWQSLEYRWDKKETYNLDATSLSKAQKNTSRRIASSLLSEPESTNLPKSHFAKFKRLGDFEDVGALRCLTSMFGASSFATVITNSDYEPIYIIRHAQDSESVVLNFLNTSVDVENFISGLGEVSDIDKFWGSKDLLQGKGFRLILYVQADAAAVATMSIFGKIDQDEKSGKVVKFLNGIIELISDREEVMRAVAKGQRCSDAVFRVLSLLGKNLESAGTRFQVSDGGDSFARTRDTITRVIESVTKKNCDRLRKMLETEYSQNIDKLVQMAIVGLNTNSFGGFDQSFREMSIKGLNNASKKITESNVGDQNIELLKNSVIRDSTDLQPTEFAEVLNILLERLALDVDPNYLTTTANKRKGTDTKRTFTRNDSCQGYVDILKKNQSLLESDYKRGLDGVHLLSGIKNPQDVIKNYRMPHQPKDKTIGVFDHGIASAIFWLVSSRSIASLVMKPVPEKINNHLYKAAMYANQDSTVLCLTSNAKIEELQSAVFRAIFMHNLYPIHVQGTSEGKELAENVKVDLNRDAFTFLAMLCDGLQNWDREKLVQQSKAIDGNEFDSIVPGTHYDLRVVNEAGSQFIEVYNRKQHDDTYGACDLINSLSEYLNGVKRMVRVLEK